MSVLWIGEQRFAAGLLWQRGEVSGRAARRTARESRSSWTVDVSGQTGFVDDAEGPGGTKPLAGALMALLRGRLRGEETWIAFVEEDGEDGTEEKRVGVVRCSGGVLLADGDEVFASAEEVAEAVDPAGLEGAVVVATPGLADRFPDAVEVDVEGLLQAAQELDALSAVRTGGASRKRVVWLVVFAVFGTAGILGWANRIEIGIRLGWVEVKKEEERPRVVVGIDSRRFLAHCRDEIARRELGLAGFDRIGVFCHAQYRMDENVGAPWSLAGRPVLEVRWQLRDALEPRVYVGLAEARLEPWFWRGVSDVGQAVGFAPLPQVLEQLDGVDRQSRPEFRARIDRLLALRGFRIDYVKERPGVEVVLETERPLSEAVALVSAIEGLDVVSVAFEDGRWRFEGRRQATQSMFQDEFAILAAPLAQAAPPEDRVKPERAVS
ncbi:MAG: hypothetical protein F4Z60_11640 [Chloroflexi bacterium]|nr:hypothetical protein [Chloroflexota bacterium]